MNDEELFGYATLEITGKKRNRFVLYLMIRPLTAGGQQVTKAIGFGVPGTANSSDEHDVNATSLKPTHPSH